MNGAGIELQYWFCVILVVLCSHHHVYVYALAFRWPVQGMHLIKINQNYKQMLGNLCCHTLISWKWRNSLIQRRMKARAFETSRVGSKAKIVASKKWFSFIHVMTLIFCASTKGFPGTCGKGKQKTQFSTKFRVGRLCFFIIFMLLFVLQCGRQLWIELSSNNLRWQGMKRSTGNLSTSDHTSAFPKA